MPSDDHLETLINTFVGTRYDAKVVEALVSGCKAGEIARGVVQYMANNPDVPSVNKPQLGSSLKVA